MTAHKPSGPFSLLSPWTTFRTYRRLREDGSASTLDRLFRSRHVLDLKLIASTTIMAGLTIVAAAALLEYGTQRNELAAAVGWEAAGKWAAAAQELLVYVGPVLVLCGAVLAWAYQQGSTRLGIVDLFACEITTLCRVGTIVDFARQFLRDFDCEPAPLKGAAATVAERGGSFTSEEEYFPVFDGNAKDLQVLEAKVVTHITSFYTYMKAARDSLRQLAQIPHVRGDDPKTGAWHTAKRNVVYMVFLSYESARKAVRDLVEYEPENAECTATILLTEVVCYGFLMKQFEPGDVRHRRLALRRAHYDKLVPALCARIEAADEHDNPDWRKAKELLPELQGRFDHACGRSKAPSNGVGHGASAQAPDATRRRPRARPRNGHRRPSAANGRAVAAQAAE